VGAPFDSNLAAVNTERGTCWLKSNVQHAVVSGLPGWDPNSYGQVVL